MQRGSKGGWPKRMAAAYMAIAIGATIIGALAPGWAQVSAGAAIDDEANVRARIAEYAAAWNRGDAKAVADCWGENGEYVSPDGDRVRGREAIQKVFADTFKAEPGRAVEAGEYTVRFPAPTTAVIEGSAVFTKPGTEPAETSFLILLVKRDERWFIDSIRETHQPAKPKPSLKLKELEWLIGDWVDETPDVQGECSYRWGPKKNSIVGHFKIKAKDEDELVGTVHLVWDPYLGSIRAWYFDSDGGFGESKWRHTGNNIWIADAHSVTPEGNTAAAQNFYKRLDANSFAFKSVGRKLGDSFLPNVDFVKFVRKPQKSGDKQ